MYYYKEIYNKVYNKEQISYLMKDSPEEASISLEPHYLALYIGVSFIHTLRDKSVSKEEILHLKEIQPSIQLIILLN